MVPTGEEAIGEICKRELLLTNAGGLCRGHWLGWGAGSISPVCIHALEIEEALRCC